MNVVLPEFVRTLWDHGNTILRRQVAFLERLGEQFKGYDAGWTSGLSRVAHNHQIAGSNPAPATKSSTATKGLMTTGAVDNLRWG